MTTASHRPLEHIQKDLKDVERQRAGLASREDQLKQELRLLSVAVETAIKEVGA
jgi:hypothetical protein